MPGNHDKEEKEHKRRINKLKARTSKMRLAVMDGYGKKSPYPLPRYFEKDYEAFHDKIQDPAFHFSEPWKDIDESYKRKLRPHYRKQFGRELDWQNASDRTTAGDAETYIKPGFHKNTIIDDGFTEINESDIVPKNKDKDGKVIRFDHSENRV